MWVTGTEPGFWRHRTQSNSVRERGFDVRANIRITGGVRTVIMICGGPHIEIRQVSMFALDVRSLKDSNRLWAVPRAVILIPAHQAASATHGPEAKMYLSILSSMNSPLMSPVSGTQLTTPLTLASNTMERSSQFCNYNLYYSLWSYPPGTLLNCTLQNHAKQDQFKLSTDDKTTVIENVLPRGPRRVASILTGGKTRIQFPLHPNSTCVDYFFWVNPDGKSWYELSYLHPEFPHPIGD